MSPLITSAFDLPDRARRQGRPRADRRRRAALRRRSPTASSVRSPSCPTASTPSAARRAGSGQEAMDRDQRGAPADSPGCARCAGSGSTCASATSCRRGRSEPVYIGRLGLTDSTGRRLLIDWRSPAAEPFFGATHANPMGLASRRRYRWTQRPDQRLLGRGVQPPTGWRGQRRPSTTSRPSSPAWAATARHGCATCSAPSRPTRTRSSGPARAARWWSTAGPAPARPSSRCTASAYLLYTDPRLGHRRGGVLFIGPHQPYLDYVADVLPSLGEDGRADLHAARPRRRRCRGAVRDRPGGGPAEVVRRAGPGDRGGGAVLRGAAGAIADGEDALVAAATAPPRTGPRRSTRAEPGTPHNEARDEVWEALLAILLDKHPATDAAPELLRRSLLQNRDLLTAFNRAWPCSRRPTWSPTSGRCRPTCASARRGSRREQVMRLAAQRRAELDDRRPAAARRGSAAARRSRGGAARPAAPGRPRDRARADGRGRRRPDRGRRLRDDGDVDAARRGSAALP